MNSELRMKGNSEVGIQRGEDAKKRELRMKGNLEFRGMAGEIMNEG